MKSLGWKADKLVLLFGPYEQRALLRILKLYPRVPPAHHHLSRTGNSPRDQANQRLLDEALAEQRAELKRFVQEFLADTARVTPLGEEWRLTLSAGDMEFLLQVLNDVRVGAWLSLGSPEGRVGLDSQDGWAMEVSGILEAELLSILEDSPMSSSEG